jgi:uncharacterized membrane protein
MKRFLVWLRTTFVSGLLAILPVGATVFIVWTLYNLIDRQVGRNTAFGMVIERVLGRWVPGLGIVITILLVFVIGVIVRSFVGRTLHYYFERIFFSFPGVRKMYGTLKQFTGALLNRESTTSFKKVVMFEYPKEGINVIGLVTNEDLGRIQDIAGEKCLLVYAPTAPNPLSGYMIVIPERLVTYIDMPVEDALSMVVSSGSVLPESLKRASGENAEQEKKPRFSPFRKWTVR